MSEMSENVRKCQKKGRIKNWNSYTERAKEAEALTRVRCFGQAKITIRLMINGHDIRTEK